MNNERKKIEDGAGFEEHLAKVRESARAYSQYGQEEVDKIFRAAAMAADQARIRLAKMAVEETGMGVVEDKVIKNHYAAEYIQQPPAWQTVGKPFLRVYVICGVVYRVGCF